MTTRQQHGSLATAPPRRPAGTDDNALTSLLAEVAADVASVFKVMDWADDEIAAATRRHPDQADRLYHAFGLLRARDIGMGMTTEFVYRSHAAELLERVAAGADTTTATAAELCLVCAEVSKQIPMHGEYAGLYFRMWQAAFPDRPNTPELASDQTHYEKLFGSRIDDIEQQLRRKCADPTRRMTDIDCEGSHHGRRVNCRYATSTRRRSKRRGDPEAPSTAPDAVDAAMDEPDPWGDILDQLLATA